MKIAFIASQGGHFNEAMMIVEEVLNFYKDVTIITFDSPEIVHTKAKLILLKPVKWSRSLIIRFVLSGLFNVPHNFFYLLKNRPDIVISTGSGDLAIPTLFMSKVLGIKTIYIETWTRVKHPSVSGRVVYYFADHFYVQWEDLLPMFGKKARYVGGLL